MKFTIGTVSNDIEFEEDLKLIKSSLLYADDIELIGMAEYAVYKYLPRCVASAKDLGELLTCFVPLFRAFDSVEMHNFANAMEEMNDNLAPFQNKLNKCKHKTSKEIIAQKKLDWYEKECRKVFSGTLQELHKYPSSQIIQELIEKNIISVFDYGFNEFSIEDFSGGYLASLLDVMKQGTSYPLFDKTSSSIVSAIINEDMLNLGLTDKEVLRHAGVATEILMTLPTLESAGIDEILDFKKDLNEPLEGFRSAIYDFSTRINTMPWDKDFKYDCLKLYNTEVLPKVKEINELASETITLKNFGKKMLADGEMRKNLGFVGAGLATTITTNSNLFIALGILVEYIRKGAKIGLSAAMVTAFMKTTDLLIQAHDEVKKNKRLMSGNVMYYYYLAQKI